jgi:hypothetical protein
VTLSAQGANKNFWGPLWGPYFLYYVKTMGQKEQAAVDQGFERTILFQPGSLDREQPTVGGSFLSSLPVSRLKVSDLAKAVLQAVKTREEMPLGVTRITGNDKIQTLLMGGT